MLRVKAEEKRRTTKKGRLKRGRPLKTRLCHSLKKKNEYANQTETEKKKKSCKNNSKTRRQQNTQQLRSY